MKSPSAARPPLATPARMAAREIAVQTSPERKSRSVRPMLWKTAPEVEFTICGPSESASAASAGAAAAHWSPYMTHTISEAKEANTAVTAKPTTASTLQMPNQHS